MIREVNGSIPANDRINIDSLGTHTGPLPRPLSLLCSFSQRHRRYRRPATPCVYEMQQQALKSNRVLIAPGTKSFQSKFIFARDDGGGGMKSQSLECISSILSVLIVTGILILLYAEGKLRKCQTI